MAQELSCSAACWVVPDQGLNLHLLHLQVDSLPLSLQGNLGVEVLIKTQLEINTVRTIRKLGIIWLHLP